MVKQIRGEKEKLGPMSFERGNNFQEEREKRPVYSGNVE